MWCSTCGKDSQSNECEYCEKWWKDNSMTNIMFDEHNLEETAKVIQRINPSASNMSVIDIMMHMKNTAHSVSWTKGGYVATLGYTLSSYRGMNTDDVHIKSSVSSWTVAQYLNNK